MKKVIVVMLVVVLMGVLLSAAAPASALDQKLQGTLRWQPTSSCGARYFVQLQVMENVFLTGKIDQATGSGPGSGSLAGCRIIATGFYYRTGNCQNFNVDKYQLACPTMP